MEAWYALLAFVVVTLVTGGVAFLAFGRDPVLRRLRGLGDDAAQASQETSIFRWADARQPSSQWRRTLEKLGKALLGRDAEKQKARHSARLATPSVRGESGPVAFSKPAGGRLNVSSHFASASAVRAGAARVTLRHTRNPVNRLR